MEPMQWLTLAVFAITILAVITNIIDATLAALIGVAVMCVVFKGILPVAFINPVEHAVAIEKAAAKHLEVIVKAAARAQVPCQVKHVTSDYPADAIIVAAKRYKCDLIFMGSHGRHGMRRDRMLGTQTQRVLAESKIPVLVHR